MDGPSATSDDHLDTGLTRTEIYRLLVGIADRLYEADRWTFFEDAGDRLVAVASSASGAPQPQRSLSPGLGIPGQAYSTNTPCVIDDCQDTRSTAATTMSSAVDINTPRSLCCVPIEGIGLLLGESAQVSAFDTGDQRNISEVVETFAPFLTSKREDLTPVLDGGHRDDREGQDRYEEIADILSHDLKNPLNIALGYLEQARRSDGEAHLEEVESALHRIDELVDEVIVLARTGVLIEDTEQVDVGSCAASAWADTHPDTASLKIESPGTVTGSERALRHIFENLFENAIHHAGPDVTVRVGSTAHGFFVEDDGPGIPSDLRTRVLNRGFSRERGSSGLGLHIVDRLVSEHGWDIEVTESTGGGARFEITTNN